MFGGREIDVSQSGTHLLRCLRLLFYANGKCVNHSNQWLGISVIKYISNERQQYNGINTHGLASTSNRVHWCTNRPQSHRENHEEQSNQIYSLPFLLMKLFTIVVSHTHTHPHTELHAERWKITTRINSEFFIMLKYRWYTQHIIRMPVARTYYTDNSEVSAHTAPLSQIVKMRAFLF